MASSQILKMAEVMARTGMSRGEVYRQIKAGVFASPLSLTEKGYSVGWLESDVEAWIASRRRKQLRSFSEVAVA